jgi:D-threo-aldose 1-dehydrogenase
MRALTKLGFGGAPLGGLYTAVSDEAAFASLQAAWDAGIRYFDTAPLYGFGLSEQRMGAFLRTKSRDEFVLSTKVGRLLRPRRGAGSTAGSIGSFVDALPNDAVYDFSADGIRRSLDDSLTRLGLDRIDIAFLHDPDDYFDVAVREAYPVLRDLRAGGVLGGIGAGMNQCPMLARFIERCDFDIVLLAGRYTLLDRSAGEAFFALCRERSVALVAGGVFNSGILAQSQPRDDATCDYLRASPEVLARARAMARACVRYGTTLPAAAVQFPLRNPAVTSVLLGTRDPAEVVANAAVVNQQLPEALWQELDWIADTARTA